MGIERERSRLRRAFGLALLAAAGTCVEQACTENKPSAPADAGGQDASPPALDATTDAPDTGDGADSSVDASADADADAQDVQVDVGNAEACAPILELDGAFIDAPADEQICGLVLPCGLPPQLATSGCSVVMVGPDGGAVADASFGCRVVEEAGCDDDVFQPVDGSPIVVNCPCDIFVGGGRRPSGPRGVRAVPVGSPLGTYLARVASEEALSIRAFDRLGMELVAHGAPAALVVAAARAAADEVRHARTMARLARRYGSNAPVVPRACGARVRSLFAVARENALEGCVRETYAALLARWQARHAAHDDLRSAFARIAFDEMGHAALAWAVARWAEPRLSTLDRRRIAHARRAEGRRLRAQLALPVRRSVARAAGVPDPRASRALLAAMLDQLL